GIDDGLAAPDRWQAQVQLDPFFLSKYELTQGQWLRMSGSLPVEYFAGDSYLRQPRLSRLDPAHSMDWNSASTVLWRWRLCLSTETQWERAARAETQGKYGTGASFSSMVGRVNFADRSFYRATQHTDSSVPDDGFVLYAPVDAMAPSAWGFYNLFGNVE